MLVSNRRGLKATLSPLSISCSSYYFRARSSARHRNKFNWIFERLDSGFVSAQSAMCILDAPSSWFDTNFACRWRILLHSQFTWALMPTQCLCVCEYVSMAIVQRNNEKISFKLNLSLLFKALVDGNGRIYSPMRTCAHMKMNAHRAAVAKRTRFCAVEYIEWESRRLRACEVWKFSFFCRFYLHFSFYSSPLSLSAIITVFVWILLSCTIIIIAVVVAVAHSLPPPPPPPSSPSNSISIFCNKILCAVSGALLALRF